MLVCVVSAQLRRENLLRLVFLWASKRYQRFPPLPHSCTNIHQVTSRTETILLFQLRREQTQIDKRQQGPRWPSERPPGGLREEEMRGRAPMSMPWPARKRIFSVCVGVRSITLECRWGFHQSKEDVCFSYVKWWKRALKQGAKCLTECRKKEGGEVVIWQQPWFNHIQCSKWLFWEVCIRFEHIALPINTCFSSKHLKMAPQDSLFFHPLTCRGHAFTILLFSTLLSAKCMIFYTILLCAVLITGSHCTAVCTSGSVLTSSCCLSLATFGWIFISISHFSTFTVQLLFSEVLRCISWSEIHTKKSLL